MKHSNRLKSSFIRSLLFLVAVSTTLAGVAATSRGQQSAGKNPITHELMWLMKRVGAPVPSPDGKWVVFSLTEAAYDDKDQVTDLWIASTDGKVKPRRLTATKAGEGSPDWSPDSQRIAFSARREGDDASQIYIIDVANGGEAVRLTNLSTGARSPRWRPDGKAILFTSTIYPGAATDEENRKAAAERKARKYRARVYEGFPVRYWDRWLDDTRASLFVQSTEPGSKAKDVLSTAAIFTKPGFSGNLGTGGEEFDTAWSPDGQSILFTAAINRNAAAYSNVYTHIFQMPAAGGEPKQLTSGEATFRNPRFRPDDKALYCTYTPENNKVYNVTRLAMFDWPAMGQPKIITSTFDRSVGGFAFAPDSKTVYLTAEEAGLEKLFRVPATGGEAQPAVDMTQGVYTGLAIPEQAPSTIILANWGSSVSPPEVVRVDLASKTQQALTSFNADRVAQIDWRPLRHFWFTSKGGKRIHNMIALPPNFDENKKYPLFILMHGGPHGMWRDEITYRWNYHLLAQPGYVVLMTDYTGSTGFGEKFAQDIQGDPLRGPGDEINQAADEAIRQFKFVDGSRQAAGGASYGGHLANWLQATTTRYKCLISHAGLIDMESQWGTSDTIYFREVGAGGPVWEQGPVWREQNPIRYAKNFRTPMLVTVGENDYRVPLNQSLENWSVLQRLRIPSKLIVFPEENHWILKAENSRFFYQEVHAWLAKYLGDTNGPAR